MSENHLHIVSFDIPYPPNYGGVIDVFYKLKMLSEKGVKIHLHCFEYPGRDRAPALEKYCEKLYYYRRKTGLFSALSIVPYIVISRRSRELIKNLANDEYPVLFEGLHSCYYLNDKRIRNKKKIYRESNIEHRYYFNLFKVSNRLLGKLYFLIESGRLLWYQRILKHSNLILAVSQSDADYLQRVFPENKVIHLPSFHANNEINVLPGKGEYALYHGNIEVPENYHAVRFLVREIFNDLDIPLVIAGMKPPEHIKKLIAGLPNTKLISNPDDEELFDLIKNAQINILVTFQATGLKLKLLNTLYNGRFNIVNSEMVEGTPLTEICMVATTVNTLKEAINSCKNIEITSNSLNKRKQILESYYSNNSNIEKLISLVF